MPESATATRLRAGEGLELFAYVKITGLPYCFFCAIDPTDTKFGSSAWTLPTGYTAVKGMMRPDDRLEQSIGDIIGGIANAERLRVTLLDFEASDANGTYEYLSRIFASGRLVAGVQPAELERTIGSDADSGDTFQVCRAQAAFANDSYIHIGGECIQVTSATAPSSGRSTVTIAARNVFPCSSVYPPTPVHVVDMTDANGTGIPGRNPLVTTEPYTMIGRTAAYYVGYMRADGTPCPEADCMLRHVGMIADVRYNEAGAAYDLEIEGILGQLEDAYVAPGLAYATIPDQLALTAPEWRSFSIELQMTDLNQVHAWQNYGRTVVTVDNGGTNIYKSAEELCNAINEALHSAVLTYLDTIGQRFFPFGITAQITSKDGQKYFQFVTSKEVPVDITTGTYAGGTSQRWRISNSGGNYGTVSRSQTLGHAVGLLSAMGFTQPVLQPEPISGGEVGRAVSVSITADKPIPRVFIPFSGRWFTSTSFEVQGPDALPTSRFLTDQLDGSGAAWVRFGDRQVVRCVATAVTGDSGLEVSTISVREKPPVALAGAMNDDVFSPGGQLARQFSDFFYYVPVGEAAFVEQVLLQPGSVTDADLSSGRLVGRLLSGRAKFGVEEPATTKFPDGIGMGWHDIMDTSSFRRSDPSDLRRFVVVDRNTKFSDIFETIAREYGWLLVWDPANSRVALRRVQLPGAPLAQQPILSESNRASVTDRTKQSTDKANLRSGWNVKYGWNPVTEKFASEFVLHDVWARSAYGASIKAEKVEDKTISPTNRNDPEAVLSAMVLLRTYFYRFPWDKCRRSLNRVGLVLAPGSVHQVVDNTLVNPFTGRRGIAVSDRIYAIVTAVSSDPLGGEGEVQFLINRQDPGANMRPWSPCALVDFDAASNGYNSGTGVLTLKSHYASDGSSKDGIDFRVGDLVTLISRDNVESTPTYSQNSTVTAVATDGSTMTIGTGLPALPTNTDTIVILRTWQTPQTDARKTGADAVAFQCSPATGVLPDSSPGHKWL